MPILKQISSYCWHSKIPDPFGAINYKFNLTKNTTAQFVMTKERTDSWEVVQIKCYRATNLRKGQIWKSNFG